MYKKTFVSAHCQVLIGEAITNDITEAISNISGQSQLQLLFDKYVQFLSIRKYRGRHERIRAEV